MIQLEVRGHAGKADNGNSGVWTVLRALLILVFVIEASVMALLQGYQDRLHASSHDSLFSVSINRISQWKIQVHHVPTPQVRLQIFAGSICEELTRNWNDNGIVEQLTE